jgi:hypothetical protein
LIWLVLLAARTHLCNWWYCVQLSCYKG